MWLPHLPGYWEAGIGQVLPCQREHSNVHDPYAVAVVNRGIVIGHVPPTISSVCSFYFLGKVVPFYAKLLVQGTTLVTSPRVA